MVAFTNLTNDVSCVTTLEGINLNVSFFQKVMESACASLFKRNTRVIQEVMRTHS